MSAILDRWAFQTAHAAPVTILPDGCRDVIVRGGNRRRPTLDITAITARPQQRQLTAQTTLVGFRLHPGTHIDVATLRRWWNQHPAPTLDAPRLNAFIRRDSRVTEALSALSVADGTPSVVARQLGVSLRTLQRVLSRAELPAPDFWRQLARARRAARGLRGSAALADVALTFGYADQAHLTRALGRWFGCTPHALRGRPDLMAILSAPGYD